MCLADVIHMHPHQLFSNTIYTTVQISQQTLGRPVEEMLASLPVCRRPERIFKLLAKLRPGGLDKLPWRESAEVGAALIPTSGSSVYWGR